MQEILCLSINKSYFRTMKRLFFIVFLFCFVFYVKAQDPQFSQFYAVPLYLGPSFAGGVMDTRVNSSFRDQWPSLPGSFITYSVSVDGYMKKYKSGIGVLALRDQAGGGKMNSTTVGLAYSYNIKVNPDFSLRPGLFFNYFQKSIGYDRLLFADQLINSSNSSLDGLPNEHTWHFDYSLSLLGFYRGLWFGVTSDHMMKLHGEIKDDEDYQDLKISAYGGVKYIVPSRSRRQYEESITFAFYYRNQRSMNQLDLGLYYTIEPLFFGVWYRGIPAISNTAISDLSFLVGLKYQAFTFGYSYDFTVSSLINTTGGSHELSLMYRFDTNLNLHRRKREAPIPCPVF